MFRVRIDLAALHTVSFKDAILLLQSGEEIIVRFDNRRFLIKLDDRCNLDEAIESISRVRSRAEIYWHNQRVAKRLSDFFAPRMQTYFNFSVFFLLFAVVKTLFALNSDLPMTIADVVITNLSLLAFMSCVIGFFSQTRYLLKLSRRLAQNKINDIKKV
jgi:hypothetical protein